MSDRVRATRGGTLLAMTSVVSQVCQFVRNVMLAHVLSPHDFGVAATLWLGTTFASMATDLGFERLLIQAAM